MPSMLSPKITGAIITVFIIVIGVVLLYPALQQERPVDNVLLTFNIINSTNLPTWCNDLSRFLQDNKINSTIFITGAMADTYPNCVTSLSNGNDIGSMRYSYDDIASISNYTAQLNQIEQGKAAVDKQGKLNSTIFRAPHGHVDQNIYSLLTRVHILADFSYTDHYNIYTDGLSGKTFYRFPMTSSKSSGNPNIPVMVTFYNYDSIKQIQDFINSGSHKFITASEVNRDTTK